MENKNQIDTVGGAGCVKILGLFIFIWGSIVLFPKTVDLLQNFAPNTVMGFTDIALWWAVANALLIEGVMVIMKIKMTFVPAKNLVEWFADGALSFTPFILSGLAQIIDSLIVKAEILNQPPEIQFAVTWGVPAIPAIMIGLVLIYSWFEAAPPGLFGDVTVGNRGGFRFPHVGNPFNAIRDWWQKGKSVNTQGVNPINPTPPLPPKLPPR